MIRVLVVDDHALIRKGLRWTLEEIPDVEVSGEASDGFEALAALRTGEFDLALLDISMPGKSGFEVLLQLKEEGCDTPILVLSVHPESQYAVRVLRAGASGYITKESAPEKLIEALRIVSSGGTYVSPEVAQRLVAALHKDENAAPHECLSDREFQIMNLLAEGGTPTEIANGLHISVKTVSTYRARIFRKMGFDSNAALVRYVVENGWLIDH